MKQRFEKVVAQHGGTVLRVCRVLLGAHDAQDAWSETFLAALRAEILIELPRRRVQPLRCPQHARAEPLRQRVQHAIVVLNVIGHAHQALRRRRQQERAYRGVHRRVGDVEQAFGFSGKPQPVSEPPQRVRIGRGCEIVR